MSCSARIPVILAIETLLPISSYENDGVEVSGHFDGIAVDLLDEMRPAPEEEPSMVALIAIPLVLMRTVLGCAASAIVVFSNL